MLNDYYQNIGIKGYFRRYGLLNGLQRGLFMANRFHKVDDYEIRKVLRQDQAFKKIDKYLQFENADPYGIIAPADITKEVVWVYWNTGIDNAPQLVKVCYESILKFSKREVILLTEENIDNYIRFPQNISIKIEKGEISTAAYTDLVRFCLLTAYGGTWMDATVLLTDDFPEYIYSSDFFAPQNSLGLIDNPVLYPAWLLHAKKNNPLIKKVRNIAFAYWENNSHPVEYLLPNLIITALLGKNPESAKKIPYLDTNCCEYLIRKLGDPFNEEEYEWIQTLTNIHKLTYKLDKSIDDGRSFYSHLFSSVTKDESTES